MTKWDIYEGEKIIRPSKITCNKHKRFLETVSLDDSLDKEAAWWHLMRLEIYPRHIMIEEASE